VRKVERSVFQNKGHYFFSVLLIHVGRKERKKKEKNEKGITNKWRK
jgi:hypothetical protein